MHGCLFAGLKVGAWMLNMLPCMTYCVPRSSAADAPSRITQFKFRIADSSFRPLTAAVVKFAALQRGWRDFRIAQ